LAPRESVGWNALETTHRFEVFEIPEKSWRADEDRPARQSMGVDALQGNWCRAL
jgi:hypothetical protein